MHIAEGVLSPAVLATGYALTAAGTALGLKKLDYDRLMTVAILAATFFVGSLIHVPIGITSAHLILNGLLGVILGWAAFPAILAALALQALAVEKQSLFPAECPGTHKPAGIDDPLGVIREGVEVVGGHEAQPERRQKQVLDGAV